MHRKPQDLINVPAAQTEGIQIIKRFSGGGTVVTDENTIFATVILQTIVLPPDVECYPRPLMKWSESLYNPVFSPYGHFNLQENGKRPRIWFDIVCNMRSKSSALLSTLMTFTSIATPA